MPKDAIAKIIIPEEYIKANYTVKDINKNSLVKVKITDGEFEIQEGKYEVIIN